LRASGLLQIGPRWERTLHGVLERAEGLVQFGLAIFHDQLARGQFELCRKDIQAVHGAGLELLLDRLLLLPLRRQ